MSYNLRRLALAALLIAVGTSPAAAARAYHDITCETTATTGTGTITLGGASGQYLPFSTQFSSGDTVSYGITSGDGKYETGIGVYTSGSPGTMTRASTIISSDGVGTKLTLSGTSTVCVEFNSVWFQPNLGTGDSPTFAGLTLSSPLTAGNGGTGIGSLGTGIATWLGTPSSANLASALTDETGSGAAVFANSPTFGAFSSDAGGTHTFPDGWAANAELIDTLYPAFWLHGTTNNRGVVYAMDASTNKFWLEPETGGTAGGTHQLYWDLSAFTFEPGHNGDWALGSATLSWSNLFLASGGVINWNNGDTVLTHSTGVLTVAPGKLKVKNSSDATQNSATTYNLNLTSSDGATAFTFGYDGTYNVIQSWNLKSLYLNPQGNSVIVGSNLELGNVSDTTLARTAAGRVTIEGKPVGLYTFASSAPSSPQAGDVWVDSTTSIAYRYVNDGDSSQWVQQPGNSVNTSTVKVQTFTTSGTYTPTAGMKTATIECVGAGGGGGGASGAAGFILAGMGGGGGAYSRVYVTAAQVGASQAVTVSSTGGAGATAGANSGTVGSDTSVGSLCVAKGGGAGGFVSNSTISGNGAGGAASGGTGDVKIDGGTGYGSWGSIGTTDYRPTSVGGASYFGGAKAVTLAAGTKTDGSAGSTYGGGGTGGFTYGTTGGATAAGGTGGGGLVVITEYLTGP